MPKNATKVREGTGWDNHPAKPEHDRRAARAAARASFEGKTFDALTDEEKDNLLKAVAIKLKLIES